MIVKFGLALVLSVTDIQCSFLDIRLAVVAVNTRFFKSGELPNQTASVNGSGIGRALQSVNVCGFNRKPGLVAAHSSL